MKVDSLLSSSSIFALIMILGTILLPFPSHAASFDCAHATTSVEQTICNDPDLSKADEQLAAQYKADLDKLSDAGKEEMHRGQREWVKYIQTICPKNGDTDQPECLKTEYKARQDELTKAVVVSDDLVIFRVDSFKAEKVPSQDMNNLGSDTGAQTPDFVRTEFAYPQIDNPHGESQIEWNQFLKQQAIKNEKDARKDKYPTSDQTISVHYDLFVNSKLISTTSVALYYEGEEGAPNNNAKSFAIPFTWLLDEKRALKVEDLFDKNKKWKEALDHLCRTSLAWNDSDRGKFEYDIPSHSKIDAIATNPDNWTVNAQGLSVQFPEEQANVATIIPWQLLAPYLVPNLPIQIADIPHDDIYYKYLSQN